MPLTDPLTEPYRRRRLRDTLLGLAVALFATLLINLPLWHALLFTDERIFPDVVLESTDEEFYVSRIREAAEGHPWLGHPYVFEYRNERYPLGTLAEATMGFLMRTFHLPIKTVSILMDLLLPFLLALLTWRAVRPVLPRASWRMLLIAVLFLGASLVWWKRPISPQVTTLLPLLYLWGYLSARRREPLVIAGRSVLIGLMMFSYPFHWTYCLIAEGIELLLHAQSLPATKPRLIRLMLFLFPLLPFFLPWLLLFHEALGDPAYAETLARLGTIDRRLPPDPVLQGKILLTLLALLYARKKWRLDGSTSPPQTHSTVMHAVPLAALLFAGLIVLNQNIVTGKEAEFANHYGRILAFPLFLSLLWILSVIARRSILLERGILLLGTIMVLSSTVRTLRTETEAFVAPPPEKRLEEASLFALLNALPPKRVILTTQSLARKFTVYTSHYPFFASETHMYVMPDEEVWKRASMQKFLIPEETFSPRVLFGSAHLNRALHTHVRCRLYALFLFSGTRCMSTAEAFLPPFWQTFQKGRAYTAEETLAALRSAHVQYILLPELPEILRPYAKEMGEAGGMKLYHIEGNEVGGRL